MVPPPCESHTRFHSFQLLFVPIKLQNNYCFERSNFRNSSYFARDFATRFRSFTVFDRQAVGASNQDRPFSYTLLTMPPKKASRPSGAGRGRPSRTSDVQGTKGHNRRQDTCSQRFKLAIPFPFAQSVATVLAPSPSAKSDITRAMQSFSSENYLLRA